jgi:hypothetical protein
MLSTLLGVHLAAAPLPRAIRLALSHFSQMARARCNGRLSISRRPPADQNVTTRRVPKIRESMRCLRTATGWPSPPTHCRENLENTLVRIEEVGWGFLPCVREAAPPAPRLASGFAAMSRMAPRTAPLHLHSTPATSAAAAVNAHSGARAVRHSAARSSPHRPLVG